MSGPPELEEFFAGLIGKSCWSVIGGVGTGSVISLHFGEKIPARRKLQNPRFTYEERNFEGELSAMFDCDWRLEDASQILSTSQNVLDDAIDLEALKRIKHRPVKHVGFTSRVHDLQIEFTEELAFGALCDWPTGNEADSNYVLFNRKTTVAVTPAGRIVVGAR
jgi:hypothetical protein